MMTLTIKHDPEASDLVRNLLDGHEAKDVSTFDGVTAATFSTEDQARLAAAILFPARVVASIAIIPTPS
jgi:hypothetical protein